MQFLFVNKIHSIEGQTIKGQVRFSEKEPWRQSTQDTPGVSTSVVSEAIGQLVSWLSLRDNQFTGRPVFLFAAEIELNKMPPAPSIIELEATISDVKENSFIFSGWAKWNDETIVSIRDCGGYFMPLQELEDPSVTKQRFESLCAGGLPENPGAEAFNTEHLVDNVLELIENDFIITRKKFKTDEPFYPDHFPRFPVTPIVVINEMIAESTRRLVLKNSPSKNFQVHPIAVQDLKIRSFIKPEDIALTQVKIIEMHDTNIETIAEISVDNKRILRGRYRYKLVNDCKN